jgi:hypothetical protein
MTRSTINSNMTVPNNNLQNNESGKICELSASLGCGLTQSHHRLFFFISLSGLGAITLTAIPSFSPTSPKRPFSLCASSSPTKLTLLFRSISENESDDRLGRTASPVGWPSTASGTLKAIVLPLALALLGIVIKLGRDPFSLAGLSWKGGSRGDG